MLNKFELQGNTDCRREGDPVLQVHSFANVKELWLIILLAK